MTVIDIHTHVFTEAMIASMQKAAPSLKLQLKPIDKDSADLDAAGVDMHLVCNVPHTFLYEEDASLTAATSAINNDSIAALVKQHPTRLRGLATVPMQSPELAVRELRRAMGELGLIGVHVGS